MKPAPPPRTSTDVARRIPRERSFRFRTAHRRRTRRLARCRCTIQWCRSRNSRDRPSRHSTIRGRHWLRSIHRSAGFAPEQGPGSRDTRGGIFCRTLRARQCWSCTCPSGIFRRVRTCACTCFSASSHVKRGWRGAQRRSRGRCQEHRAGNQEPRSAELEWQSGQRPRAGSRERVNESLFDVATITFTRACVYSGEL